MPKAWLVCGSCERRIKKATCHRCGGPLEYTGTLERDSTALCKQCNKFCVSFMDYDGVKCSHCGSTDLIFKAG